MVTVRSDGIDKERFVLGLVLSVSMWIFGKPPVTPVLHKSAF